MVERVIEEEEDEEEEEEEESKERGSKERRGEAAAGGVELKTHVPRRNACPVLGITIGPHLQERRLWLPRSECRV